MNEKLLFEFILSRNNFQPLEVFKNFQGFLLLHFINRNEQKLLFRKLI